MAHTIVWTELARNEYYDIVKYLLDKWGEKSASKFKNEVELQLSLISKMPKMYPKSSVKKGVRRCVVVKQVAMYYVEFEVEEKIIVARFFDNRKNPNKLTTEG